MDQRMEKSSNGNPKMRKLGLRKSSFSKTRISRFSLLLKQREDSQSDTETTGLAYNQLDSHENENNCAIFLLDGTVLRYYVNKSTCTGLDLMTKAAEHLGLSEFEFFGLSYVDKDSYSRWLKLENRVKAQKRVAKWSFEFRCRFYPLNAVNDLKYYVTRYLLCCQVRQDILAGRLPCSFESLARLGAYSLQADYGNATDLDERVKQKSLSAVEYLKNYPVAPKNDQTTDLLERLCEIHREFDGLTPNEADCCFLDYASKMSMYGMQFHSAFDDNKKPVTIGNNASGISVYDRHLRVCHFSWPQIIKVSYVSCKFLIETRNPDRLESPSGARIDEKSISLTQFRFTSSDLAKRCWQSVVEHHRFFRLTRLQPNRRIEGSSFFALVPRRENDSTTRHRENCSMLQDDASPSFRRRSLSIRRSANLTDWTSSRNVDQGPQVADKRRSCIEKF